MMSDTKTWKVHTASFKAKVALEAVREMKTLNLYGSIPRSLLRTISLLIPRSLLRGRSFWRLSNTLEAGFCVDCLQEALRRFGVPEIFNTDQGA